MSSKKPAKNKKEGYLKSSDLARELDVPGAFLRMGFKGKWIPAKREPNSRRYNLEEVRAWLRSDSGQNRLRRWTNARERESVQKQRHDQAQKRQKTNARKRAKEERYKKSEAYQEKKFYKSKAQLAKLFDVEFGFLRECLNRDWLLTTGRAEYSDTEYFELAKVKAWIQSAEGKKQYREWVIANTPKERKLTNCDVFWTKWYKSNLVLGRRDLPQAKRGRKFRASHAIVIERPNSYVTVILPPGTVVIELDYDAEEVIGKRRVSKEERMRKSRFGKWFRYRKIKD